ncbi:MAG: hypothetical protein ACRDJE_25355 [Dehalococcoidia bacterium]
MKSDAMWEDPIVKETREARAAHAARFNNDLQAIYADLKRQESVSGRSFASYPPKRVEVAGAADTKLADRG